MAILPFPQRTQRGTGARRDRQPDGAPDAAAWPAPELRIRLLGGFGVSVGGREVDEAAWRLRKAQSLLKLLALAPRHRLRREQIVDLLWPDLDPAATVNNLNQALYAGRRALDTAGPAQSAYPGRAAAPIIRLRRRVVALEPPGTLWIDVEAFEAAAAAARRAQDPAAYQAAIDLYTGDLLPEDRYEEWAAGRREALRETHVGLLLEVTQLHEARGAYATAVAALQQAAAVEPACEAAHAGLMRLYALAGQRQQALRQYAQLRAALRQDVDAEPDPATERLYQDILAGRFPTATTAAASADPGSVAPMRSPKPPPPVPRGEVASPAPHVARGAAVPNNLLIPLTSFVGRGREVAEVRRRLASPEPPESPERGGRSGSPPGSAQHCTTARAAPRLLTLIGAGGCGKTRLALAVATDLAQQAAAYPDGVWLVDLAPLGDPALVPQAVAAVLGVREVAEQPLLASLVDRLRPTSALLVLDNCEHLVDACARVVEALLGACPELHVLATSREPLRAGGEVTWRVPALTVPELDGPRDPGGPQGPAAGTPPGLSIERLLASEAAELFLERARAVQPDFTLTEDTAPAVAAICRRLDGLPLAIELAAARLAALPVEEIASRLDDALRLLAGGRRTALPRHQTLRATLDWSYGLLADRERALLRRLAVFAGGWDLAAAEAVCAGPVHRSQVTGGRLTTKN